MPLDLLVFGPHPDDIEIGMGATVAQHARRGDRGRPGRPDARGARLATARRTSGSPKRPRPAPCSARRCALNLALPDGCLAVDDDAQVDAVVRCVRAHRPRAIAIPHWEDRHPDHGSASRLLRQAIFRAGLRRYVTADEPWRPEWVCHYFINDAAPPSFVVDVSAVYEHQAAGARLPSRRSSRPPATRRRPRA